MTSTEWNDIRLKNLFTSVRNGTWGDEPDGQSDVFCARGTDFNRTTSRITAVRMPRRSVAPAARRDHQLSRGDLVIEKSGGSADQPVGSVALFDLDVPTVCSNFNARMQVSSSIDSRFACYLLNGLYWSGFTRRFIKQTTGIQNLDAEALLAVHCIIPPLDEQRRIADFLDAETARIDQTAALHETARAALLERRATAVFGAVLGVSFQDRIPSTLAWAKTLPAHWHGIKLGHVARMGSGHTPSRSKPEWWEDCTIPWITTGEVSQVRDDRREFLTKTRERISELGMANSSAELHPKGTVVLCRTASAGYSAVMGDDMATSQDFVTWTCGSRLDPLYLLWCLRAMRSDLLGRLAMGSTHKTIYVPDLQMLRIPLPPVQEQKQIVESIRTANKAIDAAVDVIDRQLSLLTERRNALITAAVTGQFDVTTAGRAPLSGGTE
ncbi:restriction endonuclease subunit S [Streptomyces sp. NPDC005438]|uniref:restriction endonuclease subunit S n=1 Tax=Streptomyces sp. NPDC005438 TaxID=3156880 RepID=UPI0033BD44AF